MRILLFSVAIIAIIRGNYSNNEFIGYGLILSLSNPGIILSSIVAQLEFKKMSELQHAVVLRSGIRKIFLRVILLAFLGTLLSTIIASFLSIYSENYKYNIQMAGYSELILYGFLCIFFIGLSGILSNVMQILNKGYLQIIAILFGGLVGIIFTYFLNPMIGVFAPYAAYVIFSYIQIMFPQKNKEYDLDNISR
jgi:O-antigen/teichoic acid export membrane protein